MEVEDRMADAEETATASLRAGLWSAFITALLTVITFGLAITAVPNSGAGCTQNCVTYPYLDTLSEFPRDYLWMPPAMLLVASYVALVASIHACAARHREVFSLIGLSFALLCAGILLGNYFVQFSVVPVSLMEGETEGLALLTQYNPHGLFIVLEELGYLLMGLSFLFLAAALAGRGRLERAVRWVFIAGFGLVAISFAAISAGYGLQRLDRFEIAVISIDWLVLTVNGILLSLLFKGRLQAAGQG